MTQAALFDDLPPAPGALPPGLRYEPAWLSAAEEAGLIAIVRQLPLQQARYKAYTARRRVHSFGGEFDYDSHELRPAAPLVDALLPLRKRVACWAGLPAAALVHTLVAEYAPGTPLGWHRDVPDFEDVFGVSLGSAALLRLRPWPPRQPTRADILRLPVEPRSIYALRGEARWGWQHSVAPVDALRWSVTFRTARRRAG
jgi:alkylated DNA repair dioxygenase AlkB